MSSATSEGPAYSPATEHSLLDGVIQKGKFSDQISVTVTASPERIFAALDQVTARDMPIANLLGQLRYLPGRLLGRSQPQPKESGSFIEGLKQGGTVVLAEEASKEIVFGGIGKYHQIVDQQPVMLMDRVDFLTFSDADYQKLAMSFRLEPGRDRGQYELVLEHRTQPLSEKSRRKFNRYWLIIKPMGAFVSKQLLLAVKKRAEQAA